MPIEAGMWKNAVSDVQQELAAVDHNAPPDLPMNPMAPAKAGSQRCVNVRGWVSRSTV
jgi:hypothetical protein